MKEFLQFILQAPESLRPFGEILFWLLVFLILLHGILKVLSSKPFINFYRVISVLVNRLGKVGKAVAKGAAKNLVLPEPYPRLARFFAIIFMINGYLATFLFACVDVVLVVLMIVSGPSILWGRLVGMLLFLLALYLAWFTFAELERDRLKLFGKNKSR